MNYPRLSGVIIGFSGFKWWSNLINIATYGLPHYNLSHVGIIAPVQHRFLYGFGLSEYDFDRSHETSDLIFESTTDCNIPCVLSGKVTDGVQAHYVNNRISEYNGKVWIYPLNKNLRPLESLRLGYYLMRHGGRKYDYLGAFRSGGLGFSWLESKLHDENLNSIFCSELVAAALRHIKVFTTDNSSKWNPNRLIRVLRKRGILGKPIRLK